MAERARLSHLVLVVREKRDRGRRRGSRTRGRRSAPPSRSTRCASRVGRGPTASPTMYLRSRACSPSRAQSRAGLPSACSVPRPVRPGRGAGPTADRSPGSSRRGSRHRRRRRRHCPRVISSSMKATISGTDSVAFGRWSGMPSPRSPVSSRVPRRRPLSELRAGARGGVVDLVVDVGDVVHELRPVAGRRQPRPEPHADHERPGVTDVGARVDGRAAHVHPHRPRSRRPARRASARTCRKDARNQGSARLRVVRGGALRRAGGRAAPPRAPARARRR